jgi:hypothetical protein
VAEPAAPKVQTLYGDYAVAWTLSGMTIVRARSAAEAQGKFDAMSRASMLNRSRPSFQRAVVCLDPAATIGGDDGHG